MVITIHQPEHLPWMGLFNKIAKADRFIILDSVQFEKNYFQNRNKILGTNGVQWVHVPVMMKGHMESDIAHTKVSVTGSNLKWREKYLRTIQMSYGKHPYYTEVYPVIEKAVILDTDLLMDINMALIRGFCERLEIDPVYEYSSDLGITGYKSDLILDICRKVQADVYIAGPSGRDYLNREDFEENGIEVKFNDFRHPAYTQKRSSGFISHLSAVDLFMNHGFAESKVILMKDNEGLSDF